MDIENIEYKEVPNINGNVPLFLASQVRGKHLYAMIVCWKTQVHHTIN